MKKLKIVLRSTNFIILSFIFVYVLINILGPFHKSKYQTDTRLFVGTIREIKIDGDKLQAIFHESEDMALTYYIKSKEEKETLTQLKEGDYLRVEGDLKEPSTNTMPNTFNYKEYLKHQSIYYCLQGEKITKVGQTSNPITTIRNHVIKKLKNYERSDYMYTFLLGSTKLLEEDTLTKYRENGISHLLAISGMHVSLLGYSLLKLLKQIPFLRKKRIFFISILLLFYLCLVGLKPPITRAVFQFLFTNLSDYWKIKKSPSEIFVLVLTTVLLLNPFAIFDLGFQLSFTISFFLMINKKQLSRKKALPQLFLVSIIAFLSSLPICLYNFYESNFMGPILNLFFVPLVANIIFPISIINFFFPVIDPIFTSLITILETTNNLSNKLDFATVIFAKPPIIMILLYYSSLIMMTIKRKWIVIFLLILLIHKSLPFFKLDPTLTMLDVGQGDSLLFVTEHTKRAILIDTGGIVNTKRHSWQQPKKTYSIATSITIPFLKSLGITKLDFLILTHGDYDHAGEAKKLVNNFKTNHILMNEGSLNQTEVELKTEADKLHIPVQTVSEGDEVKLENYQFSVLNPNVDLNENDNSIVLYTKIKNKQVLLLGDASKRIEKRILDVYNITNVDVLKIGHHGSNTSSSPSFLNVMNPKLAVISVGRNNRYNHPNKEVMKRLEDTKTYLTSINSTVTIYFQDNYIHVET